MHCSGCGRSGPFPLCAGCRTLSRVETLWKSLAESDLGVGLGHLRDCAGALTDLAEERLGEASLAGGSGVARPPEPPGGPPKKRKEVAEEKEKEREEAETPGKEQEARRREGLERKRTPVKDESAGSGEEVYSYVTAEEDEDKTPEEERKEVRTKRPLPAGGGIHPRGSVAKPLGLRELPVKLSHRDPQPSGDRQDDARRDRERKPTRTEEDKERGDRRGGHRSRTSGHPPPAGGSSHQVRRSRSRRKKAKGKRKRERGEEWRRQNPQWQRGWRPRHY